MKNNPSNYNNWFFNEGIELMLIPLTLIIFIFGMYSDVIDQRLNPKDVNLKDVNLKGNNYFKAETYIQLFDKEINLNENNKPKDKINIEENIGFLNIPISKQDSIKKYNFLFILDRTKSNLNPNFHKTTSIFRGKLQASLKKTFPNTFKSKKREGQDLSVKELVTLSLFKELEGKENINSICIAFYDGAANTDSTKYVRANNSHQKVWYETGTGNDFLISGIDKNNVGTVGISNQKTDFNEILELVTKNIKDKKNIVTTIISDFYHESNIVNDSLIRVLKKNEELKKIIFIKLPHNNSKKQIGYKIIREFNEYFEYDRLSYKEIDLINYTNNILKSNPKKINDYFVSNKQIMNLSEIVSDDILFYYPNSNWNGQKGGKRTINLQFKDLNYTPKTQWKITKADILKDNNIKSVYGGYYEEIDEKLTPSKFILNKWYNGFKGNKKILFTLNNLDEAYQLHLNYDSKTKIYNIKQIKLMPEIISYVGKYCFYIFMIIFLFFIASHFWRNISYLSLWDEKPNPSIIYYILEFLFILLLSSLLLLFSKLFCIIGFAISVFHLAYLGLSVYFYKKINYFCNTSTK